MSEAETNYLDPIWEQLSLLPPEGLTLEITLHIVRGQDGTQFGWVLRHEGTNEWIGARVVTLDDTPDTDVEIGLSVTTLVEQMRRRVEPF